MSIVEVYAPCPECGEEVATIDLGLKILPETKKRMQRNGKMTDWYRTAQVRVPRVYPCGHQVGLVMRSVRDGVATVKCEKVV